MTTTGALGGTWRADVTAWGAIVPWDGTAPLDWAIAADDRWHRPADERTVRQQRLGGTPVVETRVRIPGGDAVQQIWTVPGSTFVQVVNDSSVPVAVAFTRPDLLTSRPPTDVPVEGIDLPAGSLLVPIGHRARVTVALPHDRTGPGRLPDGFPPPEAVVRGWGTVVARASRLELPDEREVEAVVAARAELLLGGLTPVDEDPIDHLLGLGELVRLGEVTGAQVDDLLPDVAAAVGVIARDPGWAVDAALDAAGVVLHHAGDRRALRDLGALAGRRPPAEPPPAEPAGGVRVVPGLERRLAMRGAILPGGLPEPWRGASIAAHRLVGGPGGELSFALRWHGERPAMLWQAEGAPLRLTAPVVAPDWSSTSPSGEALWPPVAAPATP